MPQQTFFFYDLETSGFDPRQDRIMQFAGIRTDLDLKQIGEPYNILVKLNEDTLPSPDALLVTGITPQQTVAEGYTEAEFARLLMNEVFTEGTIAVGFNNIRFDDEFIRALFWRNFHDPYEWSWRDGRGRWDMLDVVRMTRALRPDGIEWPEVDGKPVNKLEVLSSANHIEHEHAHDALSDVEALIAVTDLIKQKQPQLYDYLLSIRDKKAVKRLVNLDEKRPFVYVSGRYGSDFNSATVAFPLTSGRNGNVMVYDLRHDPTPFLGLSAQDVAACMFADKETRMQDDFVRIPVKEMQYNRAPAVAPLGVLEAGGAWDRLGLTQEIIEKHRKILLSNPSFAENVRSAIEGRPEFPPQTDPEARLYDGFLPDGDAQRVTTVRHANETELADLHPDFNDERLDDLLLHYKARSYPKSLSEDEQAAWEAWRREHLHARVPQFVARLQARAQEADDNQAFILQELHLWAESILPVEED